MTISETKGLSTNYSLIAISRKRYKTDTA